MDVFRTSASWKWTRTVSASPAGSDSTTVRGPGGAPQPTW